VLSKQEAQRILSFIDLTSLGESDTKEKIAALCEKAVTTAGPVAAVCVYPQFVMQASLALVGTPVKIATVVNFPHATDSLDAVCFSIRKAMQDGAHEIDVVFPYPLFLSGKKFAARDFIRVCKEQCGERVLLKVILETGALQNPEVIAEVSRESIEAGADFLKTSTGKIPVGATIEAAQVMLDEIKKENRSVGLKISGGVRTVEQAEQYIGLAEKMMGAEWVIPSHFRIGASQLVDEILQQ
jgi:deoxyribose-phosphate aldolase